MKDVGKVVLGVFSDRERKREIKVPGSNVSIEQEEILFF